MGKGRAKKTLPIPIENTKLDQQYVEGYRKGPEDTAWAKVSAKLLSRRLPREKW